MSLYDDYRVELQFAHDFPYGVPCGTWKSKNGEIAVKDMSEQHIRNCMRIVGVDDDWYAYFQKELNRRVDNDR